MSKQNEVIAFEPDAQLQFWGPYEKASSSSLKMTNLTDSKVHFKLKTTAPKKYYVRPNAGVMDPKETITADITLQANSIDLEDKHKFMIQYIIEPEDSILTTEQLWETTDQNSILKHKLKCVFNNEATTAAADTVTDSSTLKNEVLSTIDELKNLSEQIRHMREEESTLRKEHAIMKQELIKLDELFKQTKSDDTQVARTVVWTIFVAVLCYLLGKIF